MHAEWNPCFAQNLVAIVPGEMRLVHMMFGASTPGSRLSRSDEQSSDKKTPSCAMTVCVSMVILAVTFSPFLAAKGKRSTLSMRRINASAAEPDSTSNPQTAGME